MSPSALIVAFVEMSVLSVMKIWPQNQHLLKGMALGVIPRSKAEMFFWRNWI